MAVAAVCRRRRHCQSWCCILCGSLLPLVIQILLVLLLDDGVDVRAGVIAAGDVGADAVAAGLRCSLLLLLLLLLLLPVLLLLLIMLLSCAADAFVALDALLCCCTSC